MGSSCNEFLLGPLQLNLVILVGSPRGGGDEVSYGESTLRGRSGKVNPTGGRIRGATGASNRRTGN